MRTDVRVTQYLGTIDQDAGCRQESRICHQELQILPAAQVRTFVVDRRLNWHQPFSLWHWHVDQLIIAFVLNTHVGQLDNARLPGVGITLLLARDIRCAITVSVNGCKATGNKTA
ncbi:MAG: hypothetical protein H7244_11025 [Herminiimonas sp.]|nr:hypothetical protein [Herminiimonas sp.]